MLHKHACFVFAITSLITGCNTAQAQDNEGFLKGADLSLSFRYRLEHVDQANRSRNATASTLQSLLAFQSGEVAGLQAFVELRNVSNIGAENFNNTLNGRTEFPVVADPESTEFQQAYLSYKPSKQTKIKFGRQKQSWGNQRFVSALGWRQNQRTFDGISLESKLTDALDVKYLYAFNVNRAFTDDSPIGNFNANIHLSNVTYDLQYGIITAYGHWIDMNDAFALALSTRTLGAHLTGSVSLNDNVKFGYLLEGAHQKDIKDNPFDIGVGYFHAAPSITTGGLTVRAGYEVLGGNGERAFQAPLGLLHAFNGWADQFLVTPAAGLRDAYGEVRYSLPKNSPFGPANFIVAFHRFDSDVGNIKYGTEWNALISKRILGRVNLLVKYANYQADGFSVDTDKFWLQLATKF